MTAADEKRVGVIEKSVALIEQGSKNMADAMDEIKQQLKSLPDEIVSRLTQVTDLKIDNKIQCLETKIEKQQNSTMRWIIGLAVSAILTLSGTIFALVRG